MYMCIHLYGKNYNCTKMELYTVCNSLHPLHVHVTCHIKTIIILRSHRHAHSCTLTPIPVKP